MLLIKKTIKGDILFDDTFAVYEVEIKEKEKESMRLGKQIKWMNLAEIKKLKNK